MRYDWLDAFLLKQKGVSKNLQPDWNWVRYVLADKLFAAVCLDGQGQPYYITCKLPPAEGLRLRQEYPEDVVPGYYMNKVHWNSVKPDGAVPDDVLREALLQSYQLVLQSLSKKKQAELLAE